MSSKLDHWDDRGLRRFWTSEAARAGALAECLLSAPDAAWHATIAQHRAHRHPWYDHLAQEVSLEEFASYLLEDWPAPALLPLYQRALQVQICIEGRAAMLHKIANERTPVPRDQSMRRFIAAVRARVGECVPLESFTSLIHRILVFYYGYYCNPWNLVGSLYATEIMAYHRMAQIDAGLVRLGFDSNELEFIRLYLVRDGEPAKDWSEAVLGPSMRINPALRVFVAEGIAACLETAARYLDDLYIRQIQRAQRRCTALGAQLNRAQDWL